MRVYCIALSLLLSSMGLKAQKSFPIDSVFILPVMIESESFVALFNNPLGYTFDFNPGIRTYEIRDGDKSEKLENIKQLSIDHLNSSLRLALPKNVHYHQADSMSREELLYLYHGFYNLVKAKGGADNTEYLNQKIEDYFDQGQIEDAYPYVIFLYGLVYEVTRKNLLSYTTRWSRLTFGIYERASGETVFLKIDNKEAFLRYKSKTYLKYVKNLYKLFNIQEKYK